MPKIFRLDPHVAILVAAGEVVERPASVAKELMENSIDAGAGSVTIEIMAGAMTYIRVTDNGCGIAPDDVQTAFLRHATSKLTCAEGLDAINTLGFRGEALAAIAAVSRVELLTREPCAREGISISLEAGVVTDISPAGCPEGTTVIIRDLFFNTPARLRFTKSDRTESSGVASIVIRCALSHPEVSVRFIRDGKIDFHTPGDSRVDSCIYSLFGREFSAGLIKAEVSDDTLSVTGYVSTPAATRGNRSYQYFFVNGRPVRSITLQAALERAYNNLLPAGRFPACVLYITINPGNVDVNVHPAKTEVKFASDKQVFDSVYYATLGALDSNSGTPEHLTGSSDGLHSMQVMQSGKTYSSISSGSSEIRSGSSPDSRRLTPDAPLNPPVVSQEILHSSGIGNRPFHIIGETFNTYIVVESQNSVWFIDKHAAHERIHFDALRAEAYEAMSQVLITPVICRHDPEDISLLLENSELLDKLGFSVECFGDDAVAVRRIPTEINIGDTEPVLSEICAQLKNNEAAEAVRHDSILRIVACKAAIKAGRLSGIQETEALAARVLSGEISHCPHGRPVSYVITKSTLDRSFKRI